MDFTSNIIKWYRKSKRELPWRDTNDPYFIWLSEIILQQTRVDQGLPYYLRFIDKYPTITDLAKAAEDEVLKLWQGLGYYSRARNLHATAKYITFELKGVFPGTYTEILKLKGIGDYTASAIASIAFNLPHATVDGNVYRVLSRYFGISVPIDSIRGKKEFKGLAQTLIDKKRPSLFNQAIMEFGAIQCKPQNPDCTRCPLVNGCYAFSEKKIDLLPFKEKKTKTRQRFFNYLVLVCKNETVVNKRSENDIWKGLYDFPLIETLKEFKEEAFLKHPDLIQLVGKNNFTFKAISKSYKHILSHQHIYARFYVFMLQAKTKVHLDSDMIWVRNNKLKEYPVPRLLDMYLDDSGIGKVE